MGKQIKFAHQEEKSSLVSKQKIVFPIRINRYLFLNSICSRRQADRFIEDGWIFINGEKAVIGQQVKQKDLVTWSKMVDQYRYNYVYLAYHKPIGIVTVRPNLGEKEIADVIDYPARVHPIGRLDKDSHGLIILSNDGRIVDKMLNPKFYHEKEYLVKVDQDIRDQDLSEMGRGIVIEGKKTRKARTKRTGLRTFSITITEGRNRQVRKMCEYFGYAVVDLCRVRFMKVTLGDLKPGEYREIELDQLEFENN